MKDDSENIQQPSVEEWQAMFDVLTAELLDLERISNDPKLEPEARAEAEAKLREGIPTLRRMKISRGFVPGRVRL